MFSNFPASSAFTPASAICPTLERQPMHANPPIPRPILECRNLSRALPGDPGRFLLRNISFALYSGERIAIVGPSGAGKSTLLRLINRLDEPTSGAILLDGEDTRALPPQALRRRIGLMMQRAYLFSGSVRQNIAYGPAQQNQQISDAEIDAWLSDVGLPGYGERDAQTLSGGEAQRVALLRALANQPEVLLLDEPTAALDEENRRSVEELIARLIQERQLTCLWVTHSLEQARLANRVLRLEAGQLTALGTPAQVLGELQP
ncbi:MAG TPA: choline transporter [Acidobacterium sp.]|nr:choline transporter [Acidobacterium sp.]